MKRFWVSWWSGNYLEDGCTKPPFPHWITGERDGKKGFDEQSICAVIDSESEVMAWALVRKHFPDYEQRFCNEKAEGWMPPADRFPVERGLRK